MTSPIVETHGLTKRYGSGVLAVDRLDLRIERGEVYGFLGPNGAGKTTTLRMLVGLIQPTSGTALVADHVPGEAEGLANVGSMVEYPAFYPYLSGRENLRVIARFCRIPDSRVEEVLDAVDLLERGRDSFATYSQGMKQRLGVAAALLKDPALLILDEPTNGLDPQGVVEMREMIRGLGHGERTVVLSSHLLSEVEQICQRVGVIRKGRLIAEGPLEELRGAAGLVIRAEPLDGARRRLVERMGEGPVKVRDGVIEVEMDPAEAGSVNTDLVLAGIVVTELRPRERSLEETFLELTHEEAPAS